VIKLSECKLWQVLDESNINKQDSKSHALNKSMSIDHLKLKTNGESNTVNDLREDFHFSSRGRTKTDENTHSLFMNLRKLKKD